MCNLPQYLREATLLGVRRGVGLFYLPGEDKVVVAYRPVDGIEVSLPDAQLERLDDRNYHRTLAKQALARM